MEPAACPAPPRRASRPRRAGWLLLAGAALAAGCGKGDQQRLVAVMDEVAVTCSDVAARMSEAWLEHERIHRRAREFPAGDLSHLEQSRARCGGALRLLAELDAQRDPLPAMSEDDLRGLLAMQRLLLRSVVDPRMPSAAFAATSERFVEVYKEYRPRLLRAVPLTVAEKQKLVGRSLPRWEELTREAASGGLDGTP